MADVTLQVGDRLPTVQRTVELGGAAVNLTGYTVKFSMWNAATGVIKVNEQDGTVVTAASGIVAYAWQAADVNAAGRYFGRFKCTHTATGTYLSAPNEDFIIVEIYAVGAGTDASYTGNPSDRSIDAVRFLMQDTDLPNAKLLDHEITFLLTEWNSNSYEAAASGADIVATRYARTATSTKKVGDLSISEEFGTAAAEMRAIADRIRSMAIRRYPPVPRFDDSVDLPDSPDADPYFTVGAHDNPSSEE